MKVSSDQKTVLLNLYKWFNDSKKSKYITVGGYAGTGKTTTISVFRKILNDKVDSKLKVAFCSYTGRAAQVLKNNLSLQNSLYKNDSVSTIHGLIYSPLVNTKEEIIGWTKKEKLSCSLIIIDEASMVNAKIWDDLLSYKIPIIAIGDHGQLSPIEGLFNLMENPELKLEHIHRQAKNNPIIKLAYSARLNGNIEAKKYSENVIKYSKLDYETNFYIDELLNQYNKSNTLILCGYNNTRNKLNQHIRQKLGFETPEPQVNDKVICLRNNNQKQIYNGMLGVIKKISDHDENWYKAEIKMDESDFLYFGLIFKKQFGSSTPLNFTNKRKLLMQGDLFDFGYALTVHKSQGTESEQIILFEERFSKMTEDEWKKWLYTGVTRAKNSLYIIG